MKVKIIEDIEQGFKVLYDSTRMKPIGEIFYENEDIVDFLSFDDKLDYSDSDKLSNSIHEWRISNSEARVVIKAMRVKGFSIFITEHDIDEDGEGVSDYKLQFSSYELSFKIHHKWHITQFGGNREQPPEADLKLLSASIMDLEVYEFNSGETLRLSDSNKQGIERILEKSIRT